MVLSVTLLRVTASHYLFGILKIVLIVLITMLLLEYPLNHASFDIVSSPQNDTTQRACLPTLIGLTEYMYVIVRGHRGRDRICNQCLSPLTLCVRALLVARFTQYNIM